MKHLCRDSWYDSLFFFPRHSSSSSSKSKLLDHLTSVQFPSFTLSAEEQLAELFINYIWVHGIGCQGRWLYLSAESNFANSHNVHDLFNQDVTDNLSGAPRPPRPPRSFSQKRKLEYPSAVPKGPAFGRCSILPLCWQTWRLLHLSL